MDKNDPWVVGDTLSPVENHINKFEDNFSSPSENNRLPDSAEYLAALEKKLAKIKSGKGNQKNEGKELLKSLEERSDSCMYRLIAGDSYSLTEQDSLLDAPARQLVASKWLNPEQAITVGELVQLVQADYLANQQEPDTVTSGKLVLADHLTMYQN